MPRPKQDEDDFTPHRITHQSRGSLQPGGKIGIRTVITPKVFEKIRTEAIRRGVGVATVARELIYAGLKEEDFLE